MNLSEAMAVYTSDETYENLCNDTLSLKLICDRGTKRVYKIDGTGVDFNMKMLASEDWYVIRNQ
jgi:hypothetical protein